MSWEDLQAIVSTALIDKQFSHDLLNSKRKQAIARFNLTLEERQAVTAISAETLEQFADQLDSWIARHARKELLPRQLSAFRLDCDVGVPLS